ncbi:unnamed protein product, partial [marine sediment metagenome]
DILEMAEVKRGATEVAFTNIDNSYTKKLPLEEVMQEGFLIAYEFNDKEFSEVHGYPLSGLILIGQSFIQPLRLIIVFTELIIAPLILSQIFIRTKIDKYILRFRGPIVNWGLFVVIFTVIGLNRSVFFNDPITLGKISLICSVTVIGLGLLYEFLTKKLKVDRSLYSCIMLLGTIKNGGFAAATALALFGDKASLPSAIVSVFLIIFLLYLSFRARKKYYN